MLVIVLLFCLLKIFRLFHFAEDHQKDYLDTKQNRKNEQHRPFDHDAGSASIDNSFSDPGASEQSEKSLTAPGNDNIFER